MALLSSARFAGSACVAGARSLLPAVLPRLPFLQWQAGEGSASRAVSARYYGNGAVGAEPAVAEVPQEQPNTRTYTEFGVYKGKAAVKVKVIAPTWGHYVPKNPSPTGQPAVGGSVLEREGVFLLEFANANPGNTPDNRTYNWAEKITLSLKALELGNLFTHDFNAPGSGPNQRSEFSVFHDPNKTGKGQADKSRPSVSKSFKVSLMPDGTYMFNITQRDAAGSKYIAVQISKGEFYVLNRLADRAIPSLLGFDVAATNGYGYM